MARLTIHGTGPDMDRLLKATDQQLEAAVESGARLLKVYISNNGRSMLAGPYGTGDTVGSLTLEKPKRAADGVSCQINFDGTHAHGNPRRNAEVAFVNEYGARGRPARPFIRNAIENNEDAIIERMAESLDFE